MGEVRATSSRVRPGGAVHRVQFYEQDVQLADVVAEFLAEGLGAGESVVWIGTAPHRAHLITRLRLRGVDLDAVRIEGRLVLLDAAHTLTMFMVDGSPDAALFERHVASVVEMVARRSHRGRVRAFGEMVDLLWQSGEQAAALRLEALWHALQSRLSFTLLCAYALDGFEAPADIRGVCEAHDHVDVPSEPSPVHARTIVYALEVARRLDVERALPNATDDGPRDATSGRGRRALVVAYDRDAGELLADLLRGHGFSTMVVHSNADALRDAPDFAPDFAWIDVSVADGYALAGALREIPALRQTKLVALTGPADDTDRARAEAAGFDERLVRPIAEDLLAGVVALLLDRGRLD